MSVKEVTRVRCSVCGAQVTTTDGHLDEHENKGLKTPKICYGSRIPYVVGVRGEVYPGELLVNARMLGFE